MTEEEKQERLERCKSENPDLPEEMIIEALKVIDEKAAGTFETEPYKFGADDGTSEDHK